MEGVLPFMLVGSQAVITRKISFLSRKLFHCLRPAGLHRSAKREEVMKHKCYDLELAFQKLRDHSAKVGRECAHSRCMSLSMWSAGSICQSEREGRGGGAVEGCQQPLFMVPLPISVHQCFLIDVDQ